MLSLGWADETEKLCIVSATDEHFIRIQFSLVSRAGRKIHYYNVTVKIKQ